MAVFVQMNTYIISHRLELRLDSSVTNVILQFFTNDMFHKITNALVEDYFDDPNSQQQMGDWNTFFKTITLLTKL